MSIDRIKNRIVRACRLDIFTRYRSESTLEISCNAMNLNSIVYFHAFDDCYTHVNTIESTNCVVYKFIDSYRFTK